MKIYLFLINQIVSFNLPKEVFGSFSFDENDNTDTKLINIEARDGKWVLYSTSDVSVLNGNQLEEEVPITPNNYYVLRRDEINYLIYISDIFDNSFKAYSYDANIDLTIGNSSDCSIIYNFDYLDSPIKIYNKNGQIILEKSKSSVIYINKKILELNEYYIKNGDQINIFGFKMIFLKELILINNPNNMVSINTMSISEYGLNQEQDYQDIELKDVNLYDKEDYFTKTPRLKRTITTKEILLSPPPKSDKKEDLPFILTIGPMLTMGVMSGTMLYRGLSKLIDGTGDLESVLPQLIMSAVMIMSMILWPTLTKKYNKKRLKRERKRLIEKYTTYLNTKRQELEAERSLQKEILLENLITIKECLSIINTAKLNFWDRRLEQKDFLTVRIGVGNELLDAKVNYPEEGFTIDEDELKKLADQMVADYKYIPSVPIGYSFTENRITAIMGYQNKIYPFIDNIITQILTFCSYEDLKIVVFTTKENEDKWDYIKYLNHNFNNEKSFRFFSSNPESAKRVSEYLEAEFQLRYSYVGEGGSSVPLFKPYYLIFIDNYSELKRLEFIKNATEADAPLGFSFVIIEKSLTNLPSKCNNFISLGENASGVLKNSFERQEQLTFMDEINYTINMMSISKKLSNIPIEFQEGNTQLPDAVTFLEMEKVGKVEQLNILNRWNQNDSTQSLKAEVGLDADGNLMYLDLHEKYHGPHGLIAGMTGSGKSEFIITYILSMAINYSPEDVAFILIDYKGGGLAGAFENKVTNVYLPHLAGTITNLDKAEMDRTLVSIDSEVKRRQKIFNEARDQLNESTIDIYKYQGFYKEGKLTEPVPHLFIICDEFAELKSQQPEFMSNLISVARIGRSLGVHLILATQKPSGVVNEQIWSNTKFRVCLKVQDASDSREMLKRPDAASLKQTGRFYLQVGYDEYFALGQSAWCGAKYYPSEKIIKQVDRSVNFIDDTGAFIKSIQSGNNNNKVEEQGEQISAILKSIIEVSNKENKKARRLWLNNIDPIITNDSLHEKYNVQDEKYDVKAIIGEYDAPEIQEQGILTYSLKEDGNTMIIGNEMPENEKLLNTILYSICKYHDSSEVNLYIIDYGSEELRMFSNLPQIGGMVFIGEDERFNNLFKLIRTTIKERKKLLTDYGGSIENYNNKNEKKLKQMVVIINNYEGVTEATRDLSTLITPIVRDCERYGIIMIITCTSFASVSRRASQAMKNKYVLKLNDKADYTTVFGVRVKNKPRDIFGRGLAYNGGIHEFQTASLVDEDHSESELLDQFTKETIEKMPEKATPIPELPEVVTMDMIKDKIDKISNVPIGIARDSLNPVLFNFNEYATTLITANTIDYTKNFVLSLLDVLTQIKNLTIVFIDGTKEFSEANREGISYINENFEANVKNLVDVENKITQTPELNIVYIIFGIEKFINKLDKKENIEALASSIKKSDNSNLIVIDGFKGIKFSDTAQWFMSIKNATDGIWIGKGFGNQSTFRVNKVTKEMSENIRTEYGYYLKESDAFRLKFIDFHRNDSTAVEEGEEGEEIDE